MTYKIKTPVTKQLEKISQFWYVLDAKREIVARCNNEADAREIVQAINDSARLQAIESAAREYVYHGKPDSFAKLASALAQPERGGKG